MSAELAESVGPEPWTSPGAAAQRPPRLLLTLLGDYWWQRTEPLPSAAIVALLAEFGVSDSAARAALSRLTRNGLLVTSKSGRRTYSRLSSRAAAILDDGARRIFSFGAASQPWDGMWSLVAFSIPEDNRAARDALRKQLRWRGFAPLYDGLWVSPRDHAAEVIGYLKDLDITTGTAFRAASVPADCDIPARAWDLEGLRSRYECFIAFAGQLRDAAAAGRVPPTDALIARTRVMDEWRAFPALDPDLPAELLPSAWPRSAARELFIGCYDLLAAAGRAAGPADHHRYSPELADRAAYHSSELELSAAPIRRPTGRGRSRVAAPVPLFPVRWPRSLVPVPRGPVWPQGTLACSGTRLRRWVSGGLATDVLFRGDPGDKNSTIFSYLYWR